MPACTSTFEERLWSKIAQGKPSECWEWTAAKIQGYGVLQMTRQRKLASAHRSVYELWYKEKLTSDDHIMHLCNNPGCCNPLHLYKGTAALNALHRDKTHGYRGLFTEEIATSIRNSSHSCRKLASIYNCSHTTILKIKNGSRYLKRGT
jgi:hypothetical protein